MLELYPGVGACGRMASPSPPTPAGRGVWRGGRKGEGVQELGDIQVERRFRALARGRGLGCSVDPKVPAGGAVPASLGGPGDGRALKREFIVFL